MAWLRPRARADKAIISKREEIIEIGLKKPLTFSVRRVVVYHAACSMQHGQRIAHQPLNLLRQAGFEVLEVPGSHRVCRADVAWPCPGALADRATEGSPTTSDASRRQAVSPAQQ